MDRFDISPETETYYRNQLRLPRFLVLGTFVVIAALLTFRIALSGNTPSLEPIYFGGVFLEGMLFVFGFQIAVPGPTDVIIADGRISFVWKGGRSWSIDARNLRSRVRLQEQVAPPTATQMPVKDRPDLFLSTRLRRIPLARPAYDAILAELRGGTSVRRNIIHADPHLGQWQVIEFSRRPS
jgi:hypothetical protein